MDLHELEGQVVKLLSKFSNPVGVRAETRGGEQIDLTITLATSLPRPYLNLMIQSTLEGERLRLNQVKIGLISIPGELIEWLVNWLPVDLIHAYGINHGQKSMEAQNRQSSRATGNLLSPMLASKPRLMAYYRLLSRWSQQPHQSNSLADLLRVFFRLAYGRSSTATAAAENRALLQTAATYVNRRDPALLFRLNTRHPIRYVTLRLHGRYDLAQHFILAAAVASSTNEHFAVSMGLYKELADIRKGSGFSFSDLMADKAGARFGRMAVTDGWESRYLQKSMASNSDETFFMPKVGDLPDHLGRNQFEKTFGGVNGAVYQRLLDLIEKRINQCPLYQIR